MKWTVRVATTGALTDEQAEQVIAGGCHIVHWDDTAGTLEMHYDVDADDVGAAAIQAAETWEWMDAVRRLIGTGVIGEPTQMTVRSAAHPVSSPYLSIAGIARRLGMSEPRVRQLQNDLDFPAGVPVAGAAADVYDAADIDAYDRERDRAPKGLGRPREGDEQLLTIGLQLIRRSLPAASMTAAQDSQLQKALDAQGGRFVRGKAKILLDIWHRHGAELAHLAQVDAFTAAVTRATEMWSD